MIFCFHFFSLIQWLSVFYSLPFNMAIVPNCVTKRVFTWGLQVFVLVVLVEPLLVYAHFAM